MSQLQNNLLRSHRFCSVVRSTDRVLHCERLETRRLLTAGLISASPPNASASVPVDTNIEATFNATVSVASVNDQSFVVHGRQSGRLLTSLGDITSLTSIGSVITLNPADSFFPGEFVQVSATPSLLDDSSLAVDPYVWDFRTASAGGGGKFINSGQPLGSATGWHVALGDVDGDGDLDAFVTNLQVPGGPEQDNRIWLNQGGIQGGIFGQFVDSGQSLEDTRPHDLALGDLDGDGDLDAFIGNSSNQPNTIWLNQGGLQNGTAGIFADSGLRMGNSSTRGVSLGDLDGDGDLDAFVANRGNQPNRVWINQGGVQGGDMGLFLDSGQLLGDSWSYDVALGDLDDDGDLDAFVANHGPFAIADGDASMVWWNDGTGTFSNSGQKLGDTSSRAVSLGDFDGDGDLDAFVANGDGDRLWINQGGMQGGAAGQFMDSGQILGNSIGHDLSIGDLDGDGDLDAFVANAGAAANTVWINQGGIQGGTEGLFSDSSLRLGNSDSRGVAFGDLDNDGDLDAFVVNRGSGQADQIWLNQDVSADFDRDNDIDGADFLAWQRGYGTGNNATIADGDADRNGEVNGADLTAWESQFGTPAPLISASFASQNTPPSQALLVDTKSTGLALLQSEPIPSAWQMLRITESEALDRESFYHIRTSEPTFLSVQNKDLAIEKTFVGISTFDVQRSALRHQDMAQQRPLVVRKMPTDAEKEVEVTDAAFSEWDESRNFGWLTFLLPAL